MTARTGQPKTGGRRKGSIDKAERQLISDGMAADLLAVYKALGGRKWLIEFAKNNPAEFIRQGLSRLLPAPQKESDDTGGGNHNTQNNFYGLSPLEAARRVAYALNAGLHAQKQQALERDPALIEVTGHEPVADEPAFDPKMWVPPTDAPDMPPPDDRPYHPFEAAREREREQWASEVHLTPEERAAKALCRETVEADITNYRGSASEQPGGSVPRPPERKLSAGERCRVIMSRRSRNDLL